MGAILNLDMRICLQSVEGSFGIGEYVITDAQPHCLSDSQAIGAGLIKGADSIGVSVISAVGEDRTSCNA